MKHLQLFEQFINEAKTKADNYLFKKDDLVYNNRTETVGIVRIGDDGSGEVKTDADGNVNVDELEDYMPFKYNYKNAKISSSTKKEVIKRRLFYPFNESLVNESLVNEATSSQRSANKEVKELNKILKERQSQLADAEPEDKAYCEDRVDSIQRELTHALDYQVIANMAAKTDDGLYDQEVMKELIKWHEDWIEDRQEVADQIKAVIKAKRFEKRMFATKQHGSKNELQNKLDVTESTIEFEKTRIERLESKLA